MSDTEVGAKVKKTGTQIILLSASATLITASIVWLFSTVVTNQNNTEAINATLPLIVVSMDKNTKAIIRMEAGNNIGHGAIASMVHEVKVEVAKSNGRIDRLEEDCDERHSDMEKCKEHVYASPNGNGSQ